MKNTIIKKIKNQKGFTMIENVLAATILAVGLMGGMLVMQNATATTVNSDMRTAATQLANEKIESILADNTFKGFNYIEDENYQVETQVGASNMTRTVTVIEVNADDLTTAEEASGIKKVDVSVGWGNEEAQSITVTTLISDYQ